MLSTEGSEKIEATRTAKGTQRQENCIWRQRFLALYDYPRLESTLEFPFAYKVRQFVLQGFDASALESGLRGRSGHQLDVVKDMILGNAIDSFSWLGFR